MNSKEAERQEARIDKFRRLDGARKMLRQTKNEMDSASTIPGRHPSADSPFTGNTRESRRVTDMKIVFSRTLGGEEGVELELHGLHISASALGQFIESQINTRLAELTEEIDAL